MDPSRLTALAPALVLLLVLAATACCALLGRRLARGFGQPGIVGEIACCLLLGAALVAWADRGGPGGLGGPGSAGVEPLAQAGHLGLALFLVGAAHEIRSGVTRLPGRAVLWLSAGSALLPMAAGALLAVWVLRTEDPRLRGTAPTAALVLMLAISLAVTAVPVLAGILADRKMRHTETGRLALASAVSIDAVTWVLLAVAVGLATGNGGFPAALAVLAAGVAAAAVLRRLAATAAVAAPAARHPRLAIVAVAALACAAAAGTRHFGLTDVFGAVLVGLALPADGERGPWTATAGALGRAGRLLLPLLFVVTGTTLASGPEAVLSWRALLYATTLAVAAKLTGSYLGARLGGLTPTTGLRLAALMNTRGLTEIVVLQAGYAAGILTPALHLALVVMALVTTALCGPLLWAVDRRAPVPEGMRRTAGRRGRVGSKRSFQL
ncbi:cation:proton antiporter [Streptomyces sp. NBC_01351]|uniref:cation:proton antiporter n=1 Tax=Streptomyces sp. NBC_01351 TaxID=2903833 RepID=UPI002E3497D5|nr:cation:proton antiporter [Streptomyces sp. NBC_01351]